MDLPEGQKYGLLILCIIFLLAFLFSSPVGGMDLGGGGPYFPVYPIFPIVPHLPDGPIFIVPPSGPSTGTTSNPGSTGSTGSTSSWQDVSSPDVSSGSDFQIEPPPQGSGKDLVYKLNKTAPSRGWVRKPVATPLATPIAIPPVQVLLPAPALNTSLSPGGDGFGSGSVEAASSTGDTFGTVNLTPRTNLTTEPNTTWWGNNWTMPTPMATPPTPSATQPMPLDTPPLQSSPTGAIPLVVPVVPQQPVVPAPVQPQPPVQAVVPDMKDGTLSITDGFKAAAMGKPVPSAATVVTPANAGLIALSMTVLLLAIGAFLEKRAPLRWKKTQDYFKNFFGNYSIGVAATKESKMRTIAVKAREPLVLGLSGIEILVAVIGALLYGLAFMVSKKSTLSVEIFLLYIVTAGVAITIHEVGHRYIARKYHDQVELKLWDIGILSMFLTALITGVVFAKPSRNLIAGAGSLPEAQVGRIMIAGPVISVAAALVFVPFLFLGGAFQAAATMSIMFNLIVGTYHLMPFTPMDGRSILKWNGILWFVLFVPLVTAYVLLFVTG
jgi:hypothetical protein